MLVGLRQFSTKQGGYEGVRTKDVPYEGSNLPTACPRYQTCGNMPQTMMKRSVNVLDVLHDALLKNYASSELDAGSL